MTDRDYEIIELLNKFKVATTTDIKNILFPSISTARKRLKVLIDKGKIKRVRENINGDYIYFLKEPRQIKHNLKVINFYTELSKRYKIQQFVTEKPLGTIRPDAVFAYLDEMNRIRVGCLEIELSNKGFNLKKYEKFYSSNEYKNYFPIFPEIHVISKLSINVSNSPIAKMIKIIKEK